MMISAFGPVGENALVPAAGAAFASGNRAREEIVPHVLLKAQQVKGLWECTPAVLTKGCYDGIGVEAMSRGISHPCLHSSTCQQIENAKEEQTVGGEPE